MAITLAHAKRSGQMLAVLCLDLDGFKRVNDTQGHDGGDALLRELSARLTGALRAEDTVSRVGGDEFVVMLPNVQSADYSEIVARKIIERVSERYALAKGEARIGTSVGIAMYPTHGSSDEALLKAADAALYRAKAAGKGQYRIASE